jgi:hypothetical protein
MDVVTGFTEAEIKGITFEKAGDWLRVVPHSPIEEKFIVNGARFLSKMAGTGFVPKAQFDDGGLLIENLGKSEKVWDEIAFRRNCARLLIALNVLNIAHGDLTSKNIVVKDNSPVVLDWWQAKDLDDPTPNKRRECDAYHLWRAAEELSPDTSRHIRKWLAIRERVMGGSILDLGCAEGDYLLFAAAECERHPDAGLWAVDKNMEAIANAGEVCEGLDVRFRACDITDVVDFMHDTVFLMSTWAYIVSRWGTSRARVLLKNITEQGGQLIFETQLYGDGPGPNFLCL